MKLSLIIPLYNADKYIERCLDSIISQKEFDFDYEVILINDGSVDSTEEIVKPYLQDNIKYYAQTNKGSGSARNLGITLSTGTHIWFVDADDFIEQSSFSYLEQCFLKFGYDSTFGFTYYHFENKTSVKTIGYHNAKEDQKMFSGTKYLYNRRSYLWNNIYQKNILKEFHIAFIEGIKNIEDFEFNLRYFDKVKQTVFFNYPIYNYCDNFDSTSRTRTRSNILKLSEDSYTVHATILDKLNNDFYKNRTDVTYWLQYSILGYFYSLFILNYNYTDCIKAYGLYRKSGLLDVVKIKIGLPFKLRCFKKVILNKVPYLFVYRLKKFI